MKFNFSMRSGSKSQD